MGRLPGCADRASRGVRRPPSCRGRDRALRSTTPATLSADTPSEKTAFYGAETPTPYRFPHHIPEIGNIRNRSYPPEEAKANENNSDSKLISPSMGNEIIRIVRTPSLTRAMRYIYHLANSLDVASYTSL